jgi:lipoprotein-releasing system ATP-binding protein
MYLHCALSGLKSSHRHGFINNHFVISCHQINKSYGKLQVLKDVSLVIPDKKVVCITGPSGAGKSTLLHILGTLDRPDSGEVNINGKQTVKLKDKELAAFRNKHIGFVFQFHHLLPEFTALENVCIPAFIGGVQESLAKEKGKKLLDQLGLSSRMHHRPSELSGGEQQRVSVARALINDPWVVMADEPSGNLDTARSEELHRIFFDLRDSMGQTFVIVTHNERLAAQADIVFRMQDGILLK